MINREAIIAEGQRRALVKVASTFFKGASSEFMLRHFPSLSAAYDQYLYQRTLQKQHDRQQAALMYPVATMTQPVMQQTLLGAEDPYVDLSEGYPGE